MGMMKYRSEVHPKRDLEPMEVTVLWIENTTMVVQFSYADAAMAVTEGDVTDVVHVYV